MPTRSLVIAATVSAFSLVATSGAYAESQNKATGAKSTGNAAGSAGAVQTRSKAGKKTKPAISDIVITKPVDKSSAK